MQAIKILLQIAAHYKLLYSNNETDFVDTLTTSIANGTSLFCRNILFYACLGGNIGGCMSFEIRIVC